MRLVLMLMLMLMLMLHADQSILIKSGASRHRDISLSDQFRISNAIRRDGPASLQDALLKQAELDLRKHYLMVRMR